MKILEGAGTGAGNWYKLQAGRYSLGAFFPGGVTGTITFQTSLDDGSNSFGNLADASGSDISFTATQHKIGIELPTCKIRATAAAVAGGVVDAYVQPIQCFPGITGYE